MSCAASWRADERQRTRGHDSARRRAGHPCVLPECEKAAASLTLAAAFAISCAVKPRSDQASAYSSFLGHHRARILALGRDVAIDQFDDRDRRGVRGADAGLDDAGVAAVAVGVARGQHVEQLDQLRVVEQAGMRQTAVGQAAVLGQRDQLFDIGAQFAAPWAVVVVICSCLISAAAMLRSRAVRWPMVRCSLRWPTYDACFITPFVRGPYQVPRSWRRSGRPPIRPMQSEPGRRRGLSPMRPISPAVPARASWPFPRCSPAASRGCPCRGAGPSTTALP